MLVPVQERVFEPETISFHSLRSSFPNVSRTAYIRILEALYIYLHPSPRCTADRKVTLTLLFEVPCHPLLYKLLCAVHHSLPLSHCKDISSLDWWNGVQILDPSYIIQTSYHCIINPTVTLDDHSLCSKGDSDSLEHYNTRTSSRLGNLIITTGHVFSSARVGTFCTIIWKQGKTASTVLKFTY